MQGDQGSGRDVIVHFTQAQVLIIVRCIIFRKTSKPLPQLAVAAVCGRDMTEWGELVAAIGAWKRPLLLVLSITSLHMAVSHQNHLLPLF